MGADDGILCGIHFLVVLIGGIENLQTALAVRVKKIPIVFAERRAVEASHDALI